MRDTNKEMTDNTKSKTTFCEVCENQVLTKNFKRHLVSKKHLKNVKIQEMGVEETKQEETKQEEKEEQPKQQKKPKTKTKPKQKKDKIKIVLPIREICSKDCLRKREKRMKDNPNRVIKPTPRREWVSVNGKIESQEEHEIRLRRERQRRYKQRLREKKKLEKK